MNIKRFAIRYNQNEPGCEIVDHMKAGSVNTVLAFSGETENSAVVGVVNLLNSVESERKAYADAQAGEQQRQLDTQRENSELRDKLQWITDRVNIPPTATRIRRIGQRGYPMGGYHFTRVANQTRRDEECIIFDPSGIRIAYVHGEEIARRLIGMLNAADPGVPEACETETLWQVRTKLTEQTELARAAQQAESRLGKALNEAREQRERAIAANSEAEQAIAKLLAENKQLKADAIFADEMAKGYQFEAETIKGQLNGLRDAHDQLAAENKVLEKRANAENLRAQKLETDTEGLRRGLAAQEQHLRNAIEQRDVQSRRAHSAENTVQNLRISNDQASTINKSLRQQNAALLSEVEHLRRAPWMLQCQPTNETTYQKVMRECREPSPPNIRDHEMRLANLERRMVIVENAAGIVPAWAQEYQDAKPKGEG